MALECPDCQYEGDRILYRRPTYDRKLVQQFWILLMLAAGVSAFSAYHFLENIITVRSTVQEFVNFIIANPALHQATLRDGVRMAWNAVNLLGALGIAAIIAIPVRYLYLVFKVQAGHPNTLRQIQRIAGLAIFIEVSKAGAMWFVAVHNEVIQLKPEWGAGFFLGLTLLWYSRLSPVQNYFSIYEVKLAPEQTTSG